MMQQKLMGVATVFASLVSPAIVWAQPVSSNETTNNCPQGNSPTAVTQPPAPTLEPVVERVNVDGSAIRAGRASGDFNAPLEVVSALITDFAHYREFMPRISESRVVQRRRGEVDVYFNVALADNMGSLWALTRFTIQRTANSIIVEGHSLNGGLRRLDCRLEATAIDPSHTRVAVQMLALPQLPFPDFIVDRQQTRSPQRGFVALRERAEASVRANTPTPAPVLVPAAQVNPVSVPATQ